MLEYNGNIINESDVIMRYVIGTICKQNELVTEGPIKMAKEKLLVIDLNHVK